MTDPSPKPSVPILTGPVSQLALAAAALDYRSARATFAKEINQAIAALHEHGVTANPGSTEPLWQSLITTDEGYRDHGLTALLVLLDITAGYYSTVRNATEVWKTHALEALEAFNTTGHAYSKSKLNALMVTSLCEQFRDYRVHHATTVISGWWVWFAHQHPEFSAADTDIPSRPARGSRK